MWTNEDGVLFRIICNVFMWIHNPFSKVYINPNGKGIERGKQGVTCRKLNN